MIIIKYNRFFKIINGSDSQLAQVAPGSFPNAFSLLLGLCEKWEGTFKFPGRTVSNLEYVSAVFICIFDKDESQICRFFKNRPNHNFIQAFFYPYIFYHTLDEQ